MFAKFKPINDFILVKLIPTEKTTATGLIITDDVDKKYNKGLVVCPGNSKSLQVDDVIAYNKYQGTALDEHFIVLKEEFVLGVI